MALVALGDQGFSICAKLRIPFLRIVFRSTTNRGRLTFRFLSGDFPLLTVDASSLNLHLMKRSKKQRVLIVDDEAINRLLLATALKKRSLETIEAKNGSEALEMVKEYHPDLLLLDVMMPDLTGFEVCRTLKDRPGSSYLPIILVTALHSREDVQNGIAAGADEFISKPVDINELMVRVRTLLKISEMQHVMDWNPLLVDFGTRESLESDLSGTEEPGSEGLEAEGLEAEREKSEEAGPLSEEPLKELQSEETGENLASAEASHLIQSILKANLTDFGEEINKPSAIHLSLQFGPWHCLGKLFWKYGGEIEESDSPFHFSDQELSGLGTWQEGVFISNWQDYAESLESYQQLLPADLAALEGGVRNFVLYSSGEQRILFINFGRRLQLFDLTWYRHLGSYISLLVRVFAKMGEKEEEYLALARSLAHITEIKDGDPGKHGRIRRVVALLCEKLDCSSGYAETLVDAVGLYDIGKLLIDQSILTKNGPLSEKEWERVHQSPQLASLVIEDLPRLATAREIAANLYERYDGSGYPLGREGREIPFAARLVRMADVYESLRSERSFREPYNHQDAVQLMNESREHFDPDVFTAFQTLKSEIEAIYD